MRFKDLLPKKLGNQGESYPSTACIAKKNIGNESTVVYPGGTGKGIESGYNTLAKMKLYFVKKVATRILDLSV